MDPANALKKGFDAEGTHATSGSSPRKDWFYWDYDLLYDIVKILRVNEQILKNNIKELSKFLPNKDLTKLKIYPRFLREISLSKNCHIIQPNGAIEPKKRLNDVMVIR